MKYATVSCIGDSLVNNARAPVGWPELLPEVLNAEARSRSQETEWASRNHGVNGEGLADVVRRLPGVASELQSYPGSRWLVVLVGTNDAKVGGNHGKLGRTGWRRLYEQVLHWGRRGDLGMVCCTHPPLVPSQTHAFSERSIGWLRDTSAVVRDLVAEANSDQVRLCDLADMPEDLLCDGVHTGLRGHRWIALRVAATICEVDVGVLEDLVGWKDRPRPIRRCFEVTR